MRIVYRFFAIIVVSFAVCCPVNVLGGAVDEGALAFEAKDYARAAELWKSLAEKGDPVALMLS